METDRIRDLLDQVEIFSTGALVEKQPVNIHEVLQYVISVCAQRLCPPMWSFKELYDPSLPPVLGPSRHAGAIVFEPGVKNAAEALAGQREAALITRSAPATAAASVCCRTGKWRQRILSLPIAVSIEDNGPGIPEAIRPHIFEPLISSKEEGRGLGLAVVAKLAADLGAMVELDEEKTGGTRFTVWLACA